MRCAIGQNHFTLALATLAISPGAMVADQGRGIGLRQPSGLAPATKP